MKKYGILGLVILTLLLAAFWAVKNQSKTTVNEREGNFAVKDKNDISKIVLTDADNRSAELTKKNNQWIVNGKYLARPELVEQLFDAVTRVTSLCPVPTAAHDNVIREMMARHIQTKIYDAKNNLLKSYWVGGPTVDGENTYMLLEEKGTLSARPHLTYIPGVKGYLTFRYSTDEEIWRSRILFDYNPDEIKSIRLEYPAEEEKSFAVLRIAIDSLSLTPLQLKYKIKENYQQKFIHQYLSFFSGVYLEAFDNTYSKKDSLIQTTPYCIFTITTNSDSVNQVKLYRMSFGERSKLNEDAQGNPMTYDVDRFYASLNRDKDFAIVQYYVFGKLLRSYRDFFFKPPQK